MWELSDKHETAQEDFPFKTLSCFFTVKTLELILFRWEQIQFLFSAELAGNTQKETGSREMRVQGQTLLCESLHHFES